MQTPLIVIAEDDVDDQFLLQTAFDEVGTDYQVKFVSNGVDLGGCRIIKK